MFRIALLLLFLMMPLSAMSEVPEEIKTSGKQYHIEEMYLGSTRQGTVITQYFDMTEEILLVKSRDDSLYFEQTGENDLVISIDTMPFQGRKKLTLFIETTSRVYRYDLVFDVEEVELEL